MALPNWIQKPSRQRAAQLVRASQMPPYHHVDHFYPWHPPFTRIPHRLAVKREIFYDPVVAGTFALVDLLQSATLHVATRHCAARAVGRREGLFEFVYDLRTQGGLKGRLDMPTVHFLHRHLLSGNPRLVHVEGVVPFEEEGGGCMMADPLNTGC